MRQSFSEPVFENADPRNSRGECARVSRNLSSKMLIRETLAENAPESAFRIRHVAAQAPGALDSAGWRMMLQDRRSSTEITPPQPSPSRGGGLRRNVGPEGAAGNGRGDGAFEAVRADRGDSEHPVIDADVRQDGSEFRPKHKSRRAGACALRQMRRARNRRPP